MILNLKYNRIIMKNQVREGRYSMKLRHKPVLTQKPRIYRKKTKREKRSPPTRDFGTDLTNRPQPIAIQVDTQLQQTCSTPSEIAPYLSHIVQHLISLDEHYTQKFVTHLNSNSQTVQPKVTPEMRKVLLKWLIQVGRKFQVKDETMHICVQLIDLILLHETERISKHNFQLLGVTALFVASKYNEIHTFEAEKYVYLCDGLYTLPELFEMQSLILTTTNFNMQFPTLYQFTGLALEHYGGDLDKVVNELVRLSMFDYNLFNNFKKQHLAAVIVYFAAKIKQPSTLRSKDVIEEMKIPQDIFKQCLMILLGIYRSREEVL